MLQGECLAKIAEDLDSLMIIHCGIHWFHAKTSHFVSTLAKAYSKLSMVIAHTRGTTGAMLTCAENFNVLLETAFSSV